MPPFQTQQTQVRFPWAAVDLFEEFGNIDNGRPTMSTTTTNYYSYNVNNYKINNRGHFQGWEEPITYLHEV